jgi:hypothetical protein
MDDRPRRRWSLLPGRGLERHKEREERLGKWRAMVGWETAVLVGFVLIILLGQCAP